jgi:hypothetical protein
MSTGRRISREAILAFALALLSIGSALFSEFLVIPLGLLVILLGVLVRRDIRRSEDSLRGKLLAFGAVLTVVSTAAVVLLVVPVCELMVEPPVRGIVYGNLRQCAFALNDYHSANRRFPPYAVFDKSGRPLLSWRVAILPYLNEKDLFERFKLDERAPTSTRR